MLFYGLTALATAVLHARRRFAAAAFAPVLNNVVVIAMLPAAPAARRRPAHRRRRARDDPALLLLLGLGTTAGIVGDGAGAAARAPARRGAPALPVRAGATPPSTMLAALGLDGRLRDREPDRALGRARPRQRHDGGAFVYLSAYTFFQLPHGLFAVSIMTTAAPGAAPSAGDAERARRSAHRFSRGLRLT